MSLLEILIKTRAEKPRVIFILKITYAQKLQNVDCRFINVLKTHYLLTRPTITFFYFLT